MNQHPAPMVDTTHPQIKAFEKRLKELNISRPDMYRLMGIYKEKYGNWRTRGIPKGEIFKAAKIAKCDAEQLKKGKIVIIDQKISSDMTEHAPDYDLGYNFQEIRKDRYPLISWVQAGEFEEAFDSFEIGDAEKWMPAPPMLCSDKTYVLRVRGDSMTSPYGKSYPDGCLLYVDPEKQPNTGDLVIAKVSGENAVNFKQFIMDGGNIFLKALNPSYPPITKEFRIIGTVIFAGFEP